MTSDQLRAAVTGFCARTGADPLLVQGAGGNVSWKDGDTLWVKASGTWLADAEAQDIFVPVDLLPLRQALAGGDFSATPAVLGASALKPSIETLLHALMPQRIVVHLHAIEVLAHLVRENFLAPAALAGMGVHAAVVGYHKPGEALAAAVAEALSASPGANVVFLKSHGVVIGAADIAEVGHILSSLTSAMRTEPAAMLPVPSARTSGRGLVGADHALVPDDAIQQLALNPALFARLAQDWALYPDHVVFLGWQAHACASWADLGAEELPDLLFVQGQGVYARPALNRARLAQLRCYYDVLARQPAGERLAALGKEQIAELLNWDAERYRMGLVK